MEGMDYKQIIDKWPSVAALAADLQVKRWTVQKWRWRNSIPAAWWAEIESAAKKRGISVDINQLAKIAKERAA